MSLALQCINPTVCLYARTGTELPLTLNVPPDPILFYLLFLRRRCSCDLLGVCRKLVHRQSHRSLPIGLLRRYSHHDYRHQGTKGLLFCSRQYHLCIMLKPGAIHLRTQDHLPSKQGQEQA